MFKFWFFTLCIGIILTKVKSEVSLIDGNDYVSCVATENHFLSALALIHDTKEVVVYAVSALITLKDITTLRNNRGEHLKCILRCYDPPVRIDVDFRSEKRNWTDFWNRTTSLKHDIGLSFDRRWEQLTTYFGNRSQSTWGQYLVTNTLKYNFDSDRIYIPVSVKGEGPFNLMLCNGDRKYSSGTVGCFWISFGKTNETVIKHCLHSYSIIDEGICTEPTKVTGETTSKDKWSHFYIVKIKEWINVYKLGESKPYFSYTDPHFFKEFVTRYIYASLESEGHFKKHDYPFMTTTNSGEEKQLGDLSDYKNEELLCLAFTLKMCDKCGLLITLKIGLQNGELTDYYSTTYKSQMTDWEEHKFTVNITDHKGQRKYLYIKTVGVHHNQFWFIGCIRSCSLNETRAISIKKVPRKDVYCHVVGSNYTFKLTTPQNTTNNDKCEDYDEIRMGSNCYRLSRDYPSYRKRKRVCKLSEGQVRCYCLPGHTGPYCLNNCSSGTYGYDCVSTCGKCNYYKNYSTCDSVNGKCLYGCEEDFEGDDCKTEPGSVVVHFECSSSTHNTISLNWNKPRKANGIIQTYVLKYQHIKYGSCNKYGYGQEYSLNQSNTNIIISELRPYSVYSFKISAVTTEMGPETSIRCETKSTDIPDEEELPVFDRDFKVTSHSLILINSINCEKMKGKLQYIARLKCLSPWCTDRIEIINGMDIKFSRLIPYTRYTLKLKAKRINGNLSHTTLEKSFKTLSSVPPTITGLAAYAYNDTVLSLRWKPPYPPYGQLQSYYIEVDERGNSVPPTKCNIWKNEHCCQLFHRGAGNIMITAKNYNISDWSDVFQNININYSAPGPPLNPQAHFNDSDVLIIAWQHPNMINGYLLYFEIDIFLEKQLIYRYTYIYKFELLDFILPINLGSGFLPYEKEIEIEVKTKNNVLTTGADRIKLFCPPQRPQYDINNVAKIDSSNTSIDINMPKIYGLSNNSCLYVIIINHDNKENNGLYEEIRNKCNINKESESWLAYGQQFSAIQDDGPFIKIGEGNSKEKICNITVNNKKLSPYVDYEICILIVNRFKDYTRYTTQKFKRSSSGFHVTPKPIDESYNGHYLLILLLIPILLIGFVSYKRRHAIKRKPVISDNNLELELYMVPTTRTAAPVAQGVNSMEVEPILQSPTIHSEVGIFSKLIPLADFEQYLKDSLRIGDLETQYKLLLNCKTKPWTYGSQKPNKPKNRYDNLVAYDHTRVVLEKIEGDEYSDYINANYIDGYKIPKSYIATQGPKVRTVNDFWRMIWQEKVEYIVTLANVMEEGKKKTEKYWPNINETKTFGPLRVSYLSSQLFADYEHRFVSVVNMGADRKIEQLHFTSWPDHGVPLYSQSLCIFLQKIIEIPQGNSPIVIHCSDGVGRTGTLILLDICLRMAAREGQVDILKNLQKLRCQRPNMVETAEQYKLVHMVILNWLSPITSIPCDENFENRIQQIITSDIDSQLDYLENSKWHDEVMKTMVVYSEPRISFPHKDRFPNIVPDSSGQVFLSTSSTDDEESAYINAVYVDGFQTPKKYIVTQQPLPNTQGDFWRLVFEQESSVVISLNQIPDDDKNCTAFWPSGKNSLLQPLEYLTVKFRRRVQSEAYDTLTLTIHSEVMPQKKKTIYFIMFKKWKYEMFVPNHPESLISLCQESQRLSRKGGPVIVTCYDGARASGLFLATSFTIEKMKFENNCDICLGLKVIRQNRKHFVQQREQLVYLYEIALHYIQSYREHLDSLST